MATGSPDKPSASNEQIVKSIEIYIDNPTRVDEKHFTYMRERAEKLSYFERVGLAKRVEMAIDLHPKETSKTVHDQLSELKKSLELGLHHSVGAAVPHIAARATEGVTELTERYPFWKEHPTAKKVLTYTGLATLAPLAGYLLWKLCGKIQNYVQGPPEQRSWLGKKFVGLLKIAGIGALAAWGLTSLKNLGVEGAQREERKKEAEAALKEEKRRNAIPDLLSKDTSIDDISLRLGRDFAVEEQRFGFHSLNGKTDIREADVIRLKINDKLYDVKLPKIEEQSKEMQEKLKGKEVVYDLAKDLSKILPTGAKLVLDKISLKEGKVMMLPNKHFKGLGTTTIEATELQRVVNEVVAAQKDPKRDHGKPIPVSVTFTTEKEGKKESKSFKLELHEVASTQTKPPTP